MQYVQPCICRTVQKTHNHATQRTHTLHNNSSTSAYATHILDNRHEFGPAEETLKLLKPCSKGSRMDCWESLFIHLHHRHNILIGEQQANDNNPLFGWRPYHVTLCNLLNTVYLHTAHDTHALQGKSDFILHLSNLLFISLNFYSHITYIPFITVTICSHSTDDALHSFYADTVYQMCNF